MLRVTPVPGPAATPAHHHLSRPAAAPAHHHVPSPAARPAAGVPLNTTSTVLGVPVRLEPPPRQPVYLVLRGLPPGTVVSVPPRLPPLPVTPVAAPVTLVSLPVRLVPVRLVSPVRPVPVLLGFTFCPPPLSVTSGVALSTGSLTVILLLLLMLMVMLLLVSECGEGGVGASRVPAR